MALSKKTLDLCKRMLDQRIGEVNSEIAARTSRNPDVVNTRWFSERQRTRMNLINAQIDVHEELGLAIEELREHAAGN